MACADICFTPGWPVGSDWEISRDSRLARFAGLKTCPITELGFIRVIAQTSPYQLNVDQAMSLLSQLKVEHGDLMRFLNDDMDVSRLPAWVKNGKQTTDGHLVQLAEAHGATLATLDSKIPGAFVIPLV